MASELANRIISTLGAQTAPVPKPLAADAAKVRQLPAQSGESLQRQEQVQSQARVPSLQDAVTRLNEYVQSTNRQLQFSVDKQSGQTIVKVIDLQTDQVVRQIPSDDVLALARQLRDLSKGSLFEQKV